MLQTTTCQKDIHPKLVKYLTEASEKIHLAIGWLADKGLFSLLQKKAVAGVSVKIILIEDDANKSQLEDYQQLIHKGVQIVYLDKSEREKLIDHKFVIIDKHSVLTGNYNWSHKNPPKEEFLTLTTQMPTIVQGFEEEFDYLWVLNQIPKSNPKPKNSIGTLLRKMNILQVLLGIGDTEFIHLRLQSLAAYQQDKNIANIYQALLKKEYETALALLKNFTALHQSLLECINPPIENLQREIQRLEEEIASISQEFNETQKLLHEFSKQHTTHLGDLLQQILYHSKIKAAIEAKANAEDSEKQEELEEAEKDHEEYTHSFAQAKKEKLHILSPVEQKELKKLYRQTSLKCHPDRVVEEMHDQAEEIFVELNKAYKSNDLERVKEINQQLKSGVMLSKSETITELKKLESTLQNLQQKSKNWLTKLADLKALPTFKTVNSIEDWAAYFTETKVILEEQLERLTAFNEKATQMQNSN